MRDDVYRHALEIIEAEGLPGLTLDRLGKAIADETFAGVYDHRALVVALSPDKHSAANRGRLSDRRRSVLETVQRVVEEGARTGVFRKLRDRLRLITETDVGFTQPI